MYNYANITYFSVYNELYLIYQTRGRVLQDIQTPRSGLKIRGIADIL